MARESQLLIGSGVLGDEKGDPPGSLGVMERRAAVRRED
jgi:hypothetical protein